ncbi:MAG: hypothetical protein DI589_11185 [Shinella sp.]|nr:MAG: hypothetical protein DI589_11185 [Shinella sp.]
MVTDKMVEAAAIALSLQYDKVMGWPRGTAASIPDKAGEINLTGFLDSARAALEAALSASDAEPVAFRHRLTGAPMWFLSNEGDPSLNNARLFCKNFPGKAEIEPLYAAPFADIHPDDLAVDRFAAAMKEKLAKKRDEGRGGWDNKDECSNEFLSKLLRGHIKKGDPVDVGNFCMMLHQRGERIAALVSPADTPPVIPEGWQLVPKVPTKDMQNAGDKEVDECVRVFGGASASHVYLAMLAAAPKEASHDD